MGLGRCVNGVSTHTYIRTTQELPGPDFNPTESEDLGGGLEKAGATGSLADN